MKKPSITIPLPLRLKRKLDAKRLEGYTLNGFVRATLERALAEVKVPRR